MGDHAGRSCLAASYAQSEVRTMKSTTVYVRALLSLGLVLAVLVGSSGRAPAQTIPAANSLSIMDDVSDYNIVPYIYVTRDADKKLNYAAMNTRYANGLRGDKAPGELVTLGTKAVPYWIIFSVTNKSWTDRWVLSFGQHMDGRHSLLQKVFLYDQTNRKKYIDTLTAETTPYVSKMIDKTTYVTLDLPRGRETVFFLYVVPEPGMPTTIAPRLMTPQAFADQTQNPYRIAAAIPYFLTLLMGAFLAVAIFKRYPLALLFMLFYAGQFLLFHYNNNRLYAETSDSIIMTGWLQCALLLVALLASKFFLNVGHALVLQSRILYGFMGFNLICAVMATIIPTDSFFAPFLFFMPVIIVQLFLFMLSIAQGYSRQPGGYQLALGWVCMLAGSIITLLSLLHIIMPTTLGATMYWYSLIPQGLLFLTATLTRCYVQDYARIINENEEQTSEENLSYLKQGKEAAENQRLRRLIEHERQTMNELRNRELEQNEEMRRAKDEADEANRAKSAFLAVISHEIRTPMSGVMGMIRLLLETNLTSEQNDYAQTIQDSGDAMLALLNDVLDFEKIESGNMDLEHVDFDLHRLIQGIGTLMSGHAATKKIALNIKLDKTVPRYVIGDPVRLRQVLLNLVGNSIKFTYEGGVTLSVEPDPSLDKATSGHIHKIRFAVEDTGVGISKEAQKNLFTPFAQADSSIARKFGGTGLGLAISQRLIEAMSSKIKIDSTEGHGSTFHFTLIMEEGAVEGTKRDNSLRASDKPKKSLRIMIVEDNEINQRLLREFVDRMGHKTTLSGSGEDALEKMQADEFDLILMDVELPGISGMGATKAIRAMSDRAKAAIPVIALTGNVRDEDIRNCYAANMNGHLTKPVDPKRLKGMIDKAIAGILDNPVILSDVAAAHSSVNRLDMPAQPAATTYVPPTVLPPLPKPPASLSLEDGEGFNVTSWQDNLDMDEAEEDSFAIAMNAAETHESAVVDNKPDTSDIFDVSMLSRLRESMRADALQGLLDGLLDTADDIVGFLEKASLETDRTQIIARTHELKGMAGNFGLKQLSLMAAQVEQSLRKPEEGTINLEETLKALPVALQNAKTALKDWMAS